MLNLYMRGCDLSATFEFLLKMSDATLLRILDSLYTDDTSTDPSIAMFFQWHIATVRQILVVRGVLNTA